jgi:hypothetical protein
VREILAEEEVPQEDAPEATKTTTDSFLRKRKRIDRKQGNTGLNKRLDNTYRVT